MKSASTRQRRLQRSFLLCMSCINFTQTTEIECTLRSFKAPQAAKYLAAFSSATRVTRRNPLPRRVGRRGGVFARGVSRPRSRELAPSQADWLELASFLAAASRRLPGHDLASTRLLVRLVRYCARESFYNHVSANFLSLRPSF